MHAAIVRTTRASCSWPRFMKSVLKTSLTIRPIARREKTIRFTLAHPTEKIGDSEVDAWILFPLGLTGHRHGVISIRQSMGEGRRRRMVHQLRDHVRKERVLG
ncbi:hypothetical protein NE237_010949 [Protea cynaroides]|uniref:Uncharacterized protein n=1 Tax=Protea cynaroides TaxID=273540 RepID=A0A9Q0L1E0_9MAGN|nr:hypothetical protein NE237_010949 [Protea cynaroides]